LGSFASLALTAISESPNLEVLSRNASSAIAMAILIHVNPSQGHASASTTLLVIRANDALEAITGTH